MEKERLYAIPSAIKPLQEFQYCIAASFPSRAFQANQTTPPRWGAESGQSLPNIHIYLHISFLQSHLQGHGYNLLCFSFDGLPTDASMPHPCPAVGSLAGHSFAPGFTWGISDTSTVVPLLFLLTARSSLAPQTQAATLWNINKPSWQATQCMATQRRNSISICLD